MARPERTLNNQDLADQDITSQASAAKSPEQWGNVFRSSFPIVNHDPSVKSPDAGTLDLKSLAAFIDYLKKRDTEAADRLMQLARSGGKEEDREFIEYCAEIFVTAVKYDELKVDRGKPFPGFS